MQSALEQLRKQLDDLGRQVQGIQARVQQLEQAAGAAPGVIRRARSERDLRALAGPEAPHAGAVSAGMLALVGRTLVVLGGAFLVRALSDRELVPPLVGVGAALLYAAFWILRCDRSAARGQRTSALFHGLTGLIIAHPLLWETTLGFELLAVPVAAGLALAVLVLGVAVAFRTQLRALAWSVVLAHVATCFALMLGSRDFLHPTLALLASAAAVEIVAAGDRWLRLRWPVALGSDLALCMLVSTSVFRATAQTPLPPLSRASVIAALLALPSLYLASIGMRTLLRAKPISGFEIAQSALSLLVAFGGAVFVQRASDGSPVSIGAMALALAAGGYTAAFAVIERRRGRERNFYAYTSLALLLALAGAPVLLGGAPALLTGAWSVLAMLAVGLGVSFRRITLEFHGSVYALAGAGASGLLAVAADGLLGDPQGAHPLSAPAVASAVVSFGCCAALFARRSTQAAGYALLPRSALAALVAGSLAGLLARGLTPFLLDATPLDAATPQPPAAVAAARTVVISATAIALAWAGRRFGLRELHWLVYPVLVAGAAKLLWEDLSAGEPVALFVALGAYGGALIATSRLVLGERRRVSSGAATEEGCVGQ